MKANQQELGEGKVRASLFAESVDGETSISRQSPKSRNRYGNDHSVWATELITEVNNLLLQMLKREPLSAKTVAAHLEVGQRQATGWLGQLVGAGKLKKFTKPVRYQVIPATKNSEVYPDPVANGTDDSKENIRNMSQQQHGQSQEVETPSLSGPENSLWAVHLRDQVQDLILKLVAREPMSAESIAQTLNTGQTQPIPG